MCWIWDLQPVHLTEAASHQSDGVTNVSESMWWITDGKMI